MDYENMNILQIKRELNTPDQAQEYIDPAALKREIFFKDYSPLVLDDTSNALVFEIFRLIDSAPRLEPVNVLADNLADNLTITYNSGFISGYTRAYEEIRELAKKKIKEAGDNEN